MRFSIGASYKVNMGHYESVEVSAHVTVDDVDLFTDPQAEDPDEVMALLQKEAKKHLDAYLQPELDRLSSLSDPSSMLAQTNPPPAAPRRERTTRRRST